MHDHVVYQLPIKREQVIAEVQISRLERYARARRRPTVCSRRRWNSSTLCRRTITSQWQKLVYNSMLIAGALASSRRRSMAIASSTRSRAASTSNRKSSFSAAALVRTRDTLSFMLHPKQLAAFRSEATEIPYGGAAGGRKSYLMRAAAISWCSVRAFRSWWPNRRRAASSGAAAIHQHGRRAVSP